MNTEAVAKSGWSRSSSSSRRIRRRDMVAPIVTLVVLMGGHFLLGATQPISQLIMSGALILCALAAMAIAGPKHLTFGMTLGMLTIWVFALAGWAGRLDLAAPQLASLFAAGAVWSVGYIVARQRKVLDLAWTATIWTSILYCIWFFFTQVAIGVTGARPEQGDTVFNSPASAALLFGLFALVGLARVLHLIKRMHAEAASRTEILDRTLREGLGGILLMGFSLTCLLITGTRAGVMIAGGVMIAYAWWDLFSILNREGRSASARFISAFIPVAAVALAGWGVWMAFMQHEALSASVAVVSTADHFGRVDAYYQQFRQNPVFGFGLGSVEAIGQQATTLKNAEAMLQPGGARNVFLHWMVEAGFVGLTVMLLFLLAMHVRIVAGFGVRRAPRTFLRLALAASMLMLLHGAADSSLDLPSAVWLYAFVLGAACGVVSVNSKKKDDGRRLVGQR